MDTFTFTEAPATIIPAETDIVRTSGYSAVGTGAALYGADAAVDAAYVSANPRSSFRSANGRGFRLSLDQTVTPAMFGAKSFDGFNSETTAHFAALVDDTQSLQAFFDFCATRRVESANWGGAYGVTAGLRLGGPVSGGAAEASFASTDSFDGSLVLGVKTEMAGAVLTNNGRRQTTYGPLAIVGPPAGYPLFSERLFDIGLLIQDKAQLQNYSTVHVAQARLAGVIVQNGIQGYDNTYANHFENCFFYSCGSGSLHPDTFQKAVITARSDVGAPGDVFQRSLLTVNNMPPLLVDSFGPTRDSGLPLFVRAGGDLHAVISYDRAGGRLEVFPWLPAGTVVGQSIDYVYGGGMVIKGGDAGITTGKVSTINSSAGVIAAANYNGYFTATMQTCLIGLVVGRFIFDPTQGGTTNGYWEGNDTDILWNAEDAFGAYHNISAQHNLDLAKIRSFKARHANGSKVNFSAKGLVINAGRTVFRYENELDINGGWFYAPVGFDRPVSDTIPLYGDGPTIEVSFNSDRTVQNRWGYRARVIYVTGNGANHQPTIGVTVRPSGGKKLNGGAAGAALFINGFTGPATILVELDPADVDNCRVSVMGGK